MQIGSGLAITKPSGNTVDVPVNTVKLREDEHIKVEENCINIDTVAESPVVDNTTQKQREDDNIKSAYE